MSPSCLPFAAATGRFGRPLVSGLFLLGLAACTATDDAPPQTGAQTQPPPVVTAPPAPTPPPPPPRAPGEATVALLLPMTGAQGTLGQALLNAAQMALFDVGGPNFELTLHDTGGRPDGAEQAMQAALAQQADLILGPLFSTSIAAAAPQARSRQVPVVAFSNDRTVGGRGVWVIGLDPAAQVDRVVDYAARQGLTRFAVLAPRNPYGDTALQALQQAASRYGGFVTQVATYDPIAVTDSGPIVEQLAAARDSFDALLVPAGGNELLGLATLLPFYDIDPAETQYLGTQLWEDPSLGQEVALVGGWFAAPERNGWDAWVARYRELYGESPPRLASLAYDATALAAVLAREAAQSGAAPDYNVEDLTDPNGFAGVDGIFRLRPDGSTERGLAVLELQRNAIDLRETAPTSFQRLGS